MINFLKKLKRKLRLKKLKSYIIFSENGINDFNFSVIKPLNKKYLEIGKSSVVMGNFHIAGQDGQIIIGNNCRINNSSFFCHNLKIIIDDFALISSNCIFYTHNSHSLNYLDRQTEMKQVLEARKKNISILSEKTWENIKEAPIHICSNTWIGTNCIILKGVTIGEGAIVGAGSVVAKDVPPWSVVAGNSARVVKMLK